MTLSIDGKYFETKFREYFEAIVNFLVDMVIASLLLMLGLWLIKRIVRLVSHIMEKRKIDATIRPFLITALNWTLKAFLFIYVVMFLGVKTTSIAAVLGAASLAVGLAFQGSLSNLASGLLLLVLRPIRAGDYVEIANKPAGTVHSIQLFNTRLHTLDNKVVFIPNSIVFNNEIVNYSLMPERRADIVFSVRVGSDIDAVTSYIYDEIDKIGLALREPKPFVVFNGINVDRLDFISRTWVKSDDFWDFHYALKKNVSERFAAENVEQCLATIKYYPFGNNGE